MNIIDVGIILLILMGAVVGFKRGFTKSLAKGIGFVGIIILAFILKNPLSILMYKNLPFLSFWGIFKGVTVLNILLYEVVAFLIILAILSILLKVIIFATSIFEKILNMTIILGIPSKLLGLVVGAIEYYVIVFGILFVLNLPMFNFSFINESKYNHPILNNTPILTNLSKDTIKVIDEFEELKDKYENSTDAKEFNKEAFETLLKYKVISVDSAIELVNSGKLKIEDSANIINRYKENE